MSVFEFEGTVEETSGGGACIPVPFDPAEAFGTRKSVRVVATYDGFEARSNVVSMGGRAVLGIHKATREAIGKGAGDRVRVSLARDETPRTVEIPGELMDAFTRAPEVATRYNAMSFTCRREFAAWVSDAKRQETRDRRAAKAIEMIRKGATL